MNELSQQAEAKNMEVATTMQFCFIRDSVSLVMPVTPGSYQWSSGKRVETINISQLGDVYRPGGRTRFSGSFEFLLPAQEYPWMEAGSRADPQYYLDYLSAWAADDKTVRLVISGTEINALVYIEEVTQNERDGTGDRYVTVAVREFKDLEAVEVANPNAGGTQNGGRPVPAGDANAVQSYTIVRGDTLSIICRRYYGRSTAKYYNALAKYNGIKNPHLIYPGTTIKIPSETILLGVPS